MLSGIELSSDDAERRDQVNLLFNPDHAEYSRQYLLDDIRKQVSTSCEDLLRGILTVKQEDRLTALQVLDHQFFDDIRDNYAAALAKVAA